MGIETLKAIEDDPELALVGQTDLGDDLESAIRQTEADAVVATLAAHHRPARIVGELVAGTGRVHLEGENR